MVVNEVCPIGQYVLEWKQRDVREGFVHNDLSLRPKAFDNVIDLDNVPVKDRIGDSAQATSLVHNLLVIPRHELLLN